MAEDVDLAIVRRVQNGDKQAYNLLVSKYQHRIIKLISRFISDPMEREDVAQEAFIKAYRALGNFRGESAFYTWLYRISVNTAKNHLMKASRRPPAQDVALDDSEGGECYAIPRELNTPETSMMNDQLAAAIREAFAELPDVLREAIQLRELEGMSYDEIALVMDCPIGTVRSRIFRAREAVEKAMQPYLDASTLPAS